MGTVDIHNHILYDVDDGSKDIQMSLDLIRMSFDAGVDTFVCTPHCGPKAKKEITPAILRERISILQEEAKKQIDANIQLYLGQELYYSDNLEERLREGEVLTINDTKYILLEFSPSNSVGRILRAVQSMQYAGYRVIVAHIERYPSIFKKKEYLEQLIKGGAYLQMNLNCLIGGIFDRQAAYCRKLVNEHMIHFIASDCHRTDWREPMTQEELTFIRKKCDKDWIQRVLYEHPRLVLQDKYIE